MSLSLGSLVTTVTAPLREPDDVIFPKIAQLRFPPGAVIYADGLPFNGIYILKSGIAKILVSVDGEDVFAALAMCDEILGVDSLHSSFYVSKAIAVIETGAIWVPSECLRLLMKNSNYFRSCLDDAMGKAHAERVHMITIRSRSSALERVAYFLLKVSSAVQQDSSFSKYFNVGLSRGEIAEYLGLRNETVSRKLSLLIEQGCIRTWGKRIHVRNHEALKKICGSLFLP